METLIFPAKRLRAKVIAEYLSGLHQARCVCLTCGNAAEALREEGLEVCEVGPKAALQATRWIRPEEVAAWWPGLFDATSGHLPVWLMLRIANRFREHLGDLSESKYAIPTGSGETLVCLAMAYPDVRFVALYGDDPATKYEVAAPLNVLVARLAE